MSEKESSAEEQLEVPITSIYPKAAIVIRILETRIPKVINAEEFWDAIRQIATEDGLEGCINLCYTYSYRAGYDKRICQQFLADDFRKYLMGKLGMM